MSVSWRDILTRWGLVVADLAEVYGVSVWRDEMTWPELRAYILGLLGANSRLTRTLAPSRE